MNYYNEHDPKAASWLRELINTGLIPNGDVDERSIVEVQPNELRDYTQCHFFAGIGGWSLALELAGWPEDRPVWTGSCPCQPFSTAGKGLAQADERHLWPVFFNLIKECRPEHVFGEQVASAIGKNWLDGISTDLESEGYACGATVLGAHSVGAPHIRQRLYWLAHSNNERLEGRSFGWDSRDERTSGESGVDSGLGDAECNGLQSSGRSTANQSYKSSYWSLCGTVQCRDGKTRRIPAEPAFFPLVNGISSARVGILRGAGNAIVPQVAAEFIGAFLDIQHT
jgi:DNA (cytosine-5)-methyltransferase 1